MSDERATIINTLIQLIDTIRTLHTTHKDYVTLTEQLTRIKSLLLQSDKAQQAS